LKIILKKLLSERVGTVPVAVPVPVVPAIAGDPLPENSFEGSYVAVAGRPGERTVHIVNGRTGVEIAGTGISFSILLVVSCCCCCYNSTLLTIRINAC